MKTAAEIVRECREDAGMTQKELAEKMGVSPQVMSHRQTSNSYTAEAFLEAVRLTGHEVKIVRAGSGEEVKPKTRGTGPRVVQMVEGVVYDTEKAEALCNSRKRDGDGFFMELFRDTNGRFFVVYYQLWEGGYNSISPVSPCGARFFKARYGSHEPPR